MTVAFTVKELIARSPQEVWRYLTDFGNAAQWMSGIDELTPETQGPIAIGRRLRFKARGKEHESEVTQLESGKRIGLTSKQGRVTVTYTYSLTPIGVDTEVTLQATCEVEGILKLLHPIILRAMKKSDASHLIRLGAALEHGPP